MTVREWLSTPPLWMGAAGGTGVAISSRVRLARNLEDVAFPGWAGAEECARLWTQLRPVLEDTEALSPGICAGNDELNDLERRLCFERHMISLEHARKGRGSGLVLRADETLSVMVNEEDHLRIQAMSPGLDLREPWARVRALDDHIGRHVRFAFDETWGYLTACPTNLGTGLRASVMLHLPGLALMDEMGPVVKGIQKIGLAVRGLWGEGTEAHGNLFQVSNQATLGEAEEQLLEDLEPVVRELVEHEENARVRLREKREALLRDQVGRAVGILSNAHVLSSKEALDLLSALRLGVESGILTCPDGAVINDLFLRVQPANMQWAAGRRLNAGERDEARARLVRERMNPTRKRKRRKSESDE